MHVPRFQSVTARAKLFLMEASNRSPRRYLGGLSGHLKRSALFQDRTANPNAKMISVRLKVERVTTLLPPCAKAFSEIGASPMQKDGSFALLCRNVCYLLRSWLTCACRKLNPGILVMQPAQDWATKNVPGAIDGARDRCILLQG